MATGSSGALATVRATLNSLWLCRVSVLSVAAGLLLLFYTPQAQAVFFDLHTWEVGLRHWAVFYAFVFLFWMLPTQLSARVMLQVGEDRLPEGRDASYAWLMVHLPWLLALVCLASVAAGQYAALDHIPDERSRDELEQAAYVQVVALAGITVALIAMWVLAWMALRPLLNRLAVSSGLLDNFVFRFIATAMFGQRAARQTDRADAAGGSETTAFSPQHLQTVWAAILLFAIWLASLYFIYLSPIEIAPALSRAPMLPVLIGAWIPVLTFLVYYAHRLRLPILAAFILLMTFLSNAIPGLHDMRILAQLSQTAPLETRQPSLEESLRWWRKANGCPPELRTDCNVRPIIVAAEGGASRAAFFTASLLAHLEDLSDPALRGSSPGAPLFSRQLFAISSVSGSSLGAAVFAALREDARTQAWPRPQPEAADNALWFRSGKAAGVGGVKPEPLPTAGTRKDVVQQILAGDFLTPAAAALNLDLMVPFHAKTYNAGDRTYFLEKSWEQRFADPSGRSRGVVKSTFERPFSSLAPQESTWRPLLIFNGTSVTTGRRIITSSLYPLFRSPDDPQELPDDQRTIESVFRNSYDTYDLMCLPDALPTGGACTCQQRERRHELQTLRIKGCDVRLSTAVSNSARFPVVSSHGDIGRKPADRIVDGAYFDYSGIVSALELHVQITRLDGSLRPFVLFLTNDPGFNPRACQQEAGARRPIDELDVLRLPAVPPSASNVWELFSMLRYPLDTLINTRVARSEQTMAQTVLLNRYENVKAGFMTAPQKLADLREGLQAYMSFDIISVGARCNKEKQVRPIPMNWWLAMPTQAYLDQEICAPHNRGSIAGVLSQLGEQPLPDDRPQHTMRYEAEKRRVNEQCDKRDGVPARGRQTR